MKDVNGIDILPRMKVKKMQKSGGIMPPGSPEIGIVEETVDAFGMPALRIRYRKSFRNFDQFIIIDNQINEVLLTN